MNATYTTRYAGYRDTAGLAKAAGWAKDLPVAAKAGLMLVAGPVLGLVFVIALPVAGLALAAWMAVKAVARRHEGIAMVAKRVALFAAAPFVGLAYLIAFPFVGIGALAYYGIRAARN